MNTAHCDSCDPSFTCWSKPGECRKFNARIAEEKAELEERSRADRTIKTVASVVGLHFGVAVAAIQSKDRTSRVSEARAVTFAIVHQLTGLTMTAIARSMGKHVSSVHHSITTAKNRCETEVKFLLTFTALMTQCQQRLPHSSLCKNTNPIPKHR